MIVRVMYGRCGCFNVEFGTVWAFLGAPFDYGQAEIDECDVIAGNGGSSASSLEIYLRIGICAASDNQISTDSLR